MTSTTGSAPRSAPSRPTPVRTHGRKEPRGRSDLVLEETARLAPGGARVTTLPGTTERQPPARGGGRRVIFSLLMLLALPAILGALAAWFASTQGEKIYAGRSEIVFHLPEFGSSAADRFLSTQIALASNRAVLEPVAADVGLSVEEIERRLEVDTIGDSAVMRIEFEDGDQALLLEVLRLATQRYLDLLRDVELIEGGSHQLLSAPYVLSEPVSPRPMRSGAIGAVVGLAIAFAGLIVLAQLRPSS